MTLERLFQLAAELNIDVDVRELHGELTAVSFPAAAVGGERCAIAIDYTKLPDKRERMQVLAHELGHCITGTFYRNGDSEARKAACERAADAWAYKALVPIGVLTTAVESGCTSVEQLARYFGVTETFLERAVAYYRG